MLNYYNINIYLIRSLGRSKVNTIQTKNTIWSLKFTKEDIENFTLEVCNKCHCKDCLLSNESSKREACGKFLIGKMDTSFVIENCKNDSK